MASIFSKIIDRTLPAYIVAEDEKNIAFLDINPLMKGHTLCVPKMEIDKVYDLPDETLADLMLFAKKVAKGIEKVVPCKRVAFSVIGLEVPHAHVHLMPIEAERDMNFSNPKRSFTKEDMETLQKQIAAAVVL